MLNVIIASFVCHDDLLSSSVAHFSASQQERYTQRPILSSAPRQYTTTSRSSNRPPQWLLSCSHPQRLLFCLSHPPAHIFLLLHALAITLDLFYKYAQQNLSNREQVGPITIYNIIPYIYFLWIINIYSLPGLCSCLLVFFSLPSLPL
jgi:hypothetical protein